MKRLRVSDNQNDETLSRNSLRYLRKANLTIAVNCSCRAPLTLMPWRGYRYVSTSPSRFRSMGVHSVTYLWRGLAARKPSGAALCTCCRRRGVVIDMYLHPYLNLDIWGYGYRYVSTSPSRSRSIGVHSVTYLWRGVVARVNPRNAPTSLSRSRHMGVRL